MTRRRAFLAAGLATVVIAGIASSVWAQEKYPTKPIKIVVGFEAGGPADVYARLLADHMSKSLGQPTIVENVPGAGTMLAGGQVARAAPDGYTLFFNTNTTYTNLLLYKDVPYTAESFEPVGLMYSGAAFIVAPPDSPFSSLEDLIKHAREHPGELDFSTTGLGGYVHLTGEHFNSVFGVETVAVSYGSGAAALQGVMSGEVDFSFIGAAAAVPQIHAKKVKPLAVTEPDRIPDLPDVPTVDEVAMNMGLEDPNWDTGSWYGLLAPAGTPADIVDILNKELVAFVATEEVQKRLAAEGNVGGGDMSPAEFKEYIAADTATWEKVIKTRGVKIE